LRIFADIFKIIPWLEIIGVGEQTRQQHSEKIQQKFFVKIFFKKGVATKLNKKFKGKIHQKKYNWAHN